MSIPYSFLYKALKPGRYLGADMPGSTAAPDASARRVVWYYPGRYEDSVADPAFLRAFFALRESSTTRVSRAIDFAADAWSLMGECGIAPFTLDDHLSITTADEIIFWVSDVFGAAQIPSILARLDLDRSSTRVGAVVNGCWAPRFLMGNLDWVAPAPYGWLLAGMRELVDGGQLTSVDAAYVKEQDNRDVIQKWNADAMALLPVTSNSNQQCIPVVDTGLALANVDLFAVGTDGRLGLRTPGDLVQEALPILRGTGIEGIRFVDSGLPSGTRIPLTLIELTRVYNMARTHVDSPATPFTEFARSWRAYKPHLVKPVLRLRMEAGDDTQAAIEAGRSALNDGWHGVTLVASFDSLQSFSALAPDIATVVDGWSRVAAGFDDRRPLRVELQAAPIERWQDAPSAPSEEDYRRLTYECRLLCETVSSHGGVSHPHIDQIIARSWLVATDHDIWPALTRFEPVISNDDLALHFDWCSWARNASGISGPPTVPFLRGQSILTTGVLSEAAPSSGVDGQPLAASSGENLYGRRQRKPAISRRLQAPSKNRLRACWGKSADWRFFSHLDMVRIIERAIRVAALPAAYSEGFHPRMKISFGPPLSFGLTSRAEMFDLILDRNVEDTDITALADAFPDGVELIHADGLPTQVPSLTETINEAEYSALLPLTVEVAQACIEEFFQRPVIEWTRADRPDRKPFDPRVTLRTTEIEVLPEGVRWTLRVAVGGQGQIRPAEWAALVFGFSDHQLAELVMERTVLRVRRSDEAYSLFDVARV